MEQYIVSQCSYVPGIHTCLHINHTMYTITFGKHGRMGILDKQYCTLVGCVADSFRIFLWSRNSWKTQLLHWATPLSAIIIIFTDDDQKLCLVGQNHEKISTCKNACIFFPTMTDDIERMKTVVLHTTPTTTKMCSILSALEIEVFHSNICTDWIYQIIFICKSFITHPSLAIFTCKKNNTFIKYEYPFLQKCW